MWVIEDPAVIYVKMIFFTYLFNTMWRGGEKGTGKLITALGTSSVLWTILLSPKSA